MEKNDGDWINPPSKKVVWNPKFRFQTTFCRHGSFVSYRIWAEALAGCDMARIKMAEPIFPQAPSRRVSAFQQACSTEIRKPNLTWRFQLAQEWQLSASLVYLNPQYSDMQTDGSRKSVSSTLFFIWVTKRAMSMILLQFIFRRPVSKFSYGIFSF